MNKLKKLVLFSIALILILWGSLGCQKEIPQSIPKQNNQSKMVIGFSMATLLEDRWIQDRDIFLAKAQSRDIKVIIQNANRDSNLQYQQVKDMVDSNIDVLVIAANDSYLEEKCVNYAKDNETPVVVYDRFIHSSRADIYISFDNKEVGRIMGRYLINTNPEGGYLLINGPKTDYNCTMIHSGYMEILKSYFDSNQINIVDEIWVDGWIRENAYRFAAKKLVSNSEDIVAIISQNDSMAWGVADALSEVQRLGEITLVGMDADLTACQRIFDGTQDLTVYKPIPNLVEEALNVCEKLSAGEKIIPTKTLEVNGIKIPYIAIPVVAVTKDNLEDTVIKDGFHLESEIYRQNPIIND